MSSESPATIIYSSLGVEISSPNGSALTATQPGLLIDGYNYSTGLSQLLAVDALGHSIVVGSGVAGTPAGGVLTIQGSTSMTAVVVNNATAANLLATVTQGPAGSVGQSWFTQITDATHGPVAVKAASTAAVAADPSLVVSLSPNNAASGLATTAAPTYTTATVNPLSLDTAGNLRVLGSGFVTTTAPTYTTSTPNFLSLTTTGLLRVDGSGVTQPVSGTVTANAGTGNFNVIGTGTAGTAATGVVTVQGIAGGTAIPVSGTFTTNKSTTGTMSSVGASVTSVTVLASNGSRVGAAFYNDSSSVAFLAISATAASATAFTIRLLPNSYTDLDLDYTGQCNAIWTTASGSMRVTEWT